MNMTISITMIVCRAVAVSQFTLDLPKVAVDSVVIRFAHSKQSHDVIECVNCDVAVENISKCTAVIT